MSRKARAMLAAYIMLERYNTLHSSNCENPWEYRRTIAKRLNVVLAESGLPYEVVEGYLVARSL